MWQRVTWSNRLPIKRRQLRALSVCPSVRLFRSVPERGRPAATSALWPKGPSVATDSAATNARYKTAPNHRPLGWLMEVLSSHGSKLKEERLSSNPLFLVLLVNSGNIKLTNSTLKVGHQTISFSSDLDPETSLQILWISLILIVSSYRWSSWESCVGIQSTTATSQKTAQAIPARWARASLQVFCNCHYKLIQCTKQCIAVSLRLPLWFAVSTKCA